MKGELCSEQRGLSGGDLGFFYRSGIRGWWDVIVVVAFARRKGWSFRGRWPAGFVTWVGFWGMKILIGRVIMRLLRSRMGKVGYDL